MIIDSSAILAVLFGEREAGNFRSAIENADQVRLSAANWLEVSLRVDSKNSALASHVLDDFIDAAGIDIVPVSVSMAKTARQAFRVYGKGMGHPAQLNFGDCFAYALAKETGEPLLFKGTDFAATDIPSALKA
ncbi:type II toxin-antitoxin system VapC family toxin [Hyphobacterium sp.]|uniref:type II toxin-antitoxin system VapC family toxin n=1 Tax=Hyphobacterium sp. TaxID=2004662 RepID=UPI003BAA4320